MMVSVMVIGGGIAGLGAARELALHGVRVTLLEAASRLGGRIFTCRPPGKPHIELGAEFVHGRSPGLWHLLESIPLPTREVPMHHHLLQPDGSLAPYDFEDEFETVTNRIDKHSPDESFSQFLTRHSFPPAARLHALDFVEGFHAAEADLLSVHGLLAAQKAGERIHEDQAYRINAGYDALVSWFAEELHRAGVQVVLNAGVDSIDWSEHQVHARTVHGQLHSASAAIITLPLGVLKAGTVKFNPPVPRKEHAVAALGIGHVTRVVLRFCKQFWPNQLGFVHTFDDWLPTWWSTSDPLTLIGWAGGPKGACAADVGPETLLTHSVTVLARAFGVSDGKIRGSLCELDTYNWRHDPNVRMAYSYVTAGHEDASAQLAAPVADTLFFAGEATSLDAHHGTVHGALTTGLRAAREVEHSFLAHCHEVGTRH